MKYHSYLTEMMYSYENRIIEPVNGWKACQQGDWGENSHFIEQWFDTGETLQFITEDLPIIDTPTWEQALQRARGWFKRKARPYKAPFPKPSPI